MARGDLSDLSTQKAIAVGVSGGADSMALCFLLSRWAGEHDVQIHALTVDHGLRPESWQEAEAVRGFLAGWDNITHIILKWEHGGVETAVQERAREARYGLMSGYCAEHGIGALFLAHHADDQAETVLFRLAKGSGLDGLAGMAARYAYSENLALIRPLLEEGKADIEALCADENIPSLQDPSNENAEFARPRMRAARAVLEQEGLSVSRLSTTAKRFTRARSALEVIARTAFDSAAKNINTKRVVFNKVGLLNHPDEIILRVLIIGMERLNPSQAYAPRLERVESILTDMIASKPFRKRTLGGIIFERDDIAGEIALSREHKDT